VTSDERDQEWFRMFSQEGSAVGEAAPSVLKSRVYSALIHAQQQSGPLRSLQETHEAGRELCVFEKLVEIAPIGEEAKSPFFCQLCHARILAERVENAPIFWRHCPYVAFKKS
jgi:hypothetical protein